jgi:PAS domain S-box-containing protein
MVFKPPALNLKLLSRLDRNSMRNAWEAFISKHQMHPLVPSLVAQSWKRCWPRLDPHQKPLFTRLGANHLLSAQVANFELLTLARPIMEDIYQYVERSETVLVLANTAGYILDMLGDPSTLELVRSLGIENGISLSENQLGTNAFALALLERIPAQVSGYEHYLEAFHSLSGTAAPVFDITGHPLGSLGVFTLAQNHHPHSLGLVVAGARAIESQRQADHLLGEQNRQLAGLNAILSSIDEGILVWDNDGILLHANPAATRILDLKSEQMMGKQIFDHIQFPAYLHEALKKEETLTDVEAGLGVNNQIIGCILSLRYIPGRQGNNGVIAILRHTKEIRQLVQRQLGAHASLTLDNLVGKSAGMRRVRRIAQTAAAARASILIRGEGGTGKNLLARAIHNHGPQREGPFIVFACTSIPGELIVAELAGLDDRSTGEHASSRPSKFELAEGGTLFFKDVEALPLEAQTILLNALELGIVQRLGSHQPNEIDTRIIASSSGNLEAQVKEGAFRSDLYYRLSPFEITLPPLRDRLSDLPNLVENYLERINRFQPHPIRVVPQTLELMANYRWPGNIRELEGALERAIVQSGGARFIFPEHLPEYIRLASTQEQQEEQVASLEELERATILNAARICRGNMTQMAQMLGIGRTTVWRRLKQLDIAIDQYRANLG